MTNQLLDLIRQTSCELPQDAIDAITRQHAQEAPDTLAHSTLAQIGENIQLAAANQCPLCQDTGTLTFYFTLPDGTPTLPIERAAQEAVRQATANGWLRHNTIDTLTGRSIDDNVAPGIPVIHYHFTDGQPAQVTLIMKGGGSENMSRQYALPDASLQAGRDLDGARKCVLDALWQIQGQGCAPGTLGICIGADRAEGYAAAKQQLLRPLNDSSPVPELAALEQRLLQEGNALGIGPMGTGGHTTLLAVKLTTRPRLPASYFVTIAYLCWAARRRTIPLNI